MIFREQFLYIWRPLCIENQPQFEEDARYGNILENMMIGPSFFVPKLSCIHVREKHGIGLRRTDKPLKCEQCEFECTYPSHLEKHM